jgi:nucleoside-diphosphate-sugar epimerase
VEASVDMNFLKFFLFLRLKSTKHPNTYTLSKALTEDVVFSYREKFSIVIIRPSLVWGALKEPLEGFVEGNC